VKKELYEVMCKMEDALLNEEGEEDPAFKTFFYTESTEAECEPGPSDDTSDIEIQADGFYQKMAAARGNE
jgi:hypothetical protein